MEAVERDVFEDCSILQVLKILGKKWMVFILSDLLTLQGQVVYFTDLQKSIQDKYGRAISGRVLSDCLGNLEQTGIIVRSVFTDTMPIRVSYQLTEKGNDLRIIFGVMKGWGIEWGGLQQKTCQAFSCIHNSVAMIDIDKAGEIIPWIDK